MFKAVTTLLLRPNRRLIAPLSRATQTSRSITTADVKVPSPFVSCEWLAENMLDSSKKNKKLTVFDCSWYLPAAKRDAIGEYQKAHIPGALYFDIDKIADKSVDLPHMLPSTKQFEEQVSELGVTNNDQIILYDNSNQYFASARVWWTLRTFGHDNVFVLDGGLGKWKEFGLPLEAGSPTEIAKGNFKVKKFRKELVVDMNSIREYLDKKHYQIVDARSLQRFEGKGEERPGLAHGHIPGSLSLPFNFVLDADGLTGKLKDGQEIYEAFKKAGVDFSKPIVTSCGSGVSASVLALALATKGLTNVAVYDGSWTEYGNPKHKLPVETGLPNKQK
jgi:thiosulfate/3-mercaptopyruvate sulfurtransferase